MPRYARRVDLNQSPIVDAFRQAGARVRVTSDLGRGHPDLIVVFEDADGRTRTEFVEVKGPKGKLTKPQREWIEQTGITPRIVRSPEEAIELLGLRFQVIDMHERRVAQARHHGGRA